jgi:hypothetical protein
MTSTAAVQAPAGCCGLSAAAHIRLSPVPTGLTAVGILPIVSLTGVRLVALRGAFLVGPGAGDDDDVRHVGMLLLDGGPGVFEGGDDPAAVLLDGPGGQSWPHALFL